MQKLVYSFNEGSKDMKNLLGGKGANLSEMTKIGLRVPFGFIVATTACNDYYAAGKKLSEDLITEIQDQMEVLEHVAGKKFGDRENPLLVSVRSGAEFSMPGMMDTILNLGLNDETVEGLAILTEDPRFAYDSYRRFIQMYGDVVLEIEKEKFDKIFDGKKAEAGVVSDVDLGEEDLKDLVKSYKILVREETGNAFPQDPKNQLLSAVEAMFRSWNNDRAVLYRKMNQIPDHVGTAVTVQTMVFGNMGMTSGSGVAFSRNPSNGNPELFGEFLVNAQGEDVVSGIRTPKPIEEMEDIFPDAYKDFQRIARVLEQHYKDMQDMEFTIEQNKLYMLQTKAAKRSAECAIRVAVDMVGEGLISKETAVDRIDASQIDQLLPPAFDAFNQLMSWADEIRTLKIRTNADNPQDARKGLEFGAEGIGLCRTEHMFFEEERLPLMRQMIMAQNETERRKALEKLLPYQKADFKAIYDVMGDKPVTIRLLDPPLHAFLPHTNEDMRELSEASGISDTELRRIAKALQEHNPMLGHRGCRLAVTYPEIAEMQTRAIIEAAIEVAQEKNIVIVPEIMIPLVGMEKELAAVKSVVVKTIKACQATYETELDYFIGTMIEVPRAALTAGEIAKEAEFFSFGTNDLTQMAYGFSRDDAGKIIKEYIKSGILEDDPFQTIDQKGVGLLMENAVKLGKQTRANLKLGICGDHGGDPRSIAFCHQIGLHYVSCSPFRVPVARIAAAQAAIRK